MKRPLLKADAATKRRKCVVEERSSTTLHYTWSERPGYVPLTRKEAELALRIAEYDAERAADLLTRISHGA